MLQFVQAMREAAEGALVAPTLRVETEAKLRLHLGQEAVFEGPGFVCVVFCTNTLLSGHGVIWNDILIYVQDCSSLQWYALDTKRWLEYWDFR